MGRSSAYIVNEDCAKVSDDVDDAEDEASGAEHGEVGASIVAAYWAAGLAVVVDRFGADTRSASDCRQLLVHILWAAKLGTRDVDQVDEDHQHHMHCRKRCSTTAGMRRW
jgi:hypothetical protein